MKLHELTAVPGSNSKSKRIGRGHGSGWGKTSGKGHKGQKARSGGSIRPGFEGGQMPLSRRLPKRGFNNIFAAKPVAINVSDLAKFDNGAVVDTAALIEKGIIKKADNGVKVLGHGELNVKLTVKLAAFSETAKQKIEAAGGNVEVM